jgi:multidrug efflux pump subunit AcrA (membrane-fusion protein)
MTVFARIAVKTIPSAILVPEVSLVPTGEGYRVFVVDTAGIAHARDVTVGGRADGMAEITGGLAVGEVVVAAGAYGVTDSARVAKRP